MTAWPAHTQTEKTHTHTHLSRDTDAYKRLRQGANERRSDHLLKKKKTLGLNCGRASTERRELLSRDAAGINDTGSTQTHARTHTRTFETFTAVAGRRAALVTVLVTSFTLTGQSFDRHSE